MADQNNGRLDKRRLLSSFFITVLIGLAYQEMIPPLKDAMRIGGVTWHSSLLAITFFFVSMRFFIGNQLHLLSKPLSNLPGIVWIYDLMVIIAQSVALIFLAGLSSVSASRETSLGFVELLIALYIVDIAWIVSQWLLGRFFRPWKRTSIPWAWAVLNTVLVSSILFLNWLAPDIYSQGTLALLLLFNVVAFIVDVVLVDHYDLFPHATKTVGSE